MKRWLPLPAPETPVPAAYRGVWVRTLLKTPEVRDTTTHVLWLQTDGWHADLRVPAGVDPGTPDGRMALQGFCGITRIAPGQEGKADICTWDRRWDIQPPRSTPDAGHMVFETPDRVIETGVHGDYLEVWERLPGSVGPCRAQMAVDATGRPSGEQRFMTGHYQMTVRPRTVCWPDDVRPDESLADLVRRHPQSARDLLDFDMVFGPVPSDAAPG